MNDLKFTTAGEYMSDVNSQIDKVTGQHYFVNEAGLRVDAVTGDLLPTIEVQAQCLAP
jgi:hypothetical protein